MNKSVIFASIFALASCAEQALTTEEVKLFGEEESVLQPANLPSLNEVADKADELSAAYFRAARSAQNEQDIASAGVVLAATSVATGSITGVADSVLSKRAVGAVALQQVASRGVSESTIKSVYDGAQVLNCIGTVSRIYAGVGGFNDQQDSAAAAKVAEGVIREVRINARKGLTREVATYSALIGAFESVIENEDGEKALRAGARKASPPNSVTPSELEVFLKRLGGCTKSKNVSETSTEE